MNQLLLVMKVPSSIVVSPHVIKNKKEQNYRIFENKISIANNQILIELLKTYKLFRFDNQIF